MATTTTYRTAIREAWVLSSCIERASRDRRAWALLLLGISVPLVFGPGEALAKERRLRLVAVGDVNLNRSRVEVREDGIFLWGKVVPFGQMFDKIKEEIDGDVNFCNLETSVMDRNDIPYVEKEYNFRSHPNALRAIRKVGFNLYSIANNHIRDYGDEGIKETRKWLASVAEDHKLWFAGAGKNMDEASDVVVFKVHGIRIAFGAVAMSPPASVKIGGAASAHRPDPVLEKLKNAEVDVRILSIHAGEEKSSKPNGTQFRVARTAVAKYKVDIVLGHHAHVVQGIELYKGGLIFYGLGNFAMRGAKDMGSVKEFRGVRDFGLLLRLDLVWDTEAKKLSFKRLETVPVYGMHSGPHRFKEAEQAKGRVEALNRLSTADYLGKGSAGVTLDFEQGKGVFLFDGKKKEKKPEEKKPEEKKPEEKKSEESSARLLSWTAVVQDLAHMSCRRSARSEMPIACPQRGRAGCRGRSRNDVSVFRPQGHPQRERVRRTSGA
jgi:poly-gamma-glutamate synthesis protein (capsule biosynthesis protein)